MTVKRVAGATNFVLQEALTALSHEEYTNARKLSGTGIVGDNPQIDTSTETFIGQARWWKPLNPNINVLSLTDPTPGVTTSTQQDYLTYVKTARSHGATQVNIQQVITQQDGLAKIGRDFGETRAQDEHDAILSVLKGVALSEVLLGAGTASGSAGLGGQTFDNDPTDKRYGFYVDMGASSIVTAASAANQGAARAEGFLQAIGKAYKDYELDYYYLIASPETIASLRSANLVDQDRVRDGNIEFNTIFQGKFRLVPTRANQGFSTAELAKINAASGVSVVGTKTTFIVAPGSMAFRPLSVPLPTEVDRDAAAYRGGGTTSIWYRWGYVLMPAGYNWAGNPEAFPTNDEYRSARLVGTGVTYPKLADVVSSGEDSEIDDITGVWERKTHSALSLGILPVFHS